MKVKTLLAFAVAGAFAVPFAAQAKDPSVSSDSGTGNPELGRNTTSRGASVGTFSSMDTNRDGYISREEARNWAHFNH